MQINYTTVCLLEFCMSDVCRTFRIRVTKHSVRRLVESVNHSSYKQTKNVATLYAIPELVTGFSDKSLKAKFPSKIRKCHKISNSSSNSQLSKYWSNQNVFRSLSHIIKLILSFFFLQLCFKMYSYQIDKKDAIIS